MHKADIFPDPNLGSFQAVDHEMFVDIWNMAGSARQVKYSIIK